MAQPLKEEHYHAFGMIVNYYADVETGLKFCISAILGVSLDKAMACTAPYSAYHLAAVTKALAKDHWAAEAPALVSIIDRWTKFTHIRTCVAHHRWREGIRPDSIRPTYQDVKTGELKIAGYKEEEKDYLVQDLLDIARDINTLGNDLRNYVKNSGVDVAIARINPEIKTATE